MTENSTVQVLKENRKPDRHTNGKRRCQDPMETKKGKCSAYKQSWKKQSIAERIM